MNSEPAIPYVFFGTPKFSVQVLKQLQQSGLPPRLVVTNPDKKRGRGQELQPTPTKAWAQDHGINVMTPQTIDQNFLQTLQEKAPDGGWPLFVVVAYGKILPEELIYLPEHNTLNLHPSLLPKVRGAAPIRGTILKEDQAGVTVIELDEKMDHGPVVVQKAVKTTQWPPRYDELKPKLASSGGKLLAQIIPQWVDDQITADPQNDSQATYIEKFSSGNGEIDFNDDPETNLRKIRAFTNWPKAHFYTNDGTRVLITGAHIHNGELVIDTVKPANETEMPYDTFQNEHE